MDRVEGQGDIQLDRRAVIAIALLELNPVQRDGSVGIQRRERFLAAELEVLLGIQSLCRVCEPVEGLEHLVPDFLAFRG